MRTYLNGKGLGAVVAGLMMAMVAPSLRAGAYVEVLLDMDPLQAGRQHRVVVPAGAEAARDVAVYIRDPLASRTFYSIGYLGAIDRGIALGHMPGGLNKGQVTGLTVTQVTPLNPGNQGWATGDPFVIKAFAGPELHYLEMGSAQPVKIPAEPAAPILRVDVVLAGATAGDRFKLFLLDYVTVWTSGAHGSFSTQAALNTLDTGGDSVPDGTETIHGVDPDLGLASPPAAFEVDFIDGPATGGAALIVVFARGDLNCDEEVDFADINPFVLALTDPGGYQQQYADCGVVLADINADKKVDFGDINPFVALLTNP